MSRPIWYSFQPINGQAYIIDNLKEKRSLVKKPNLTEDALCELNNNLFEAVDTKQNITLTYYINGKIKSINGRIELLNKSRRNILISNTEIMLKSIIKIEFN